MLKLCDTWVINKAKKIALEVLKSLYWRRMERTC